MTLNQRRQSDANLDKRRAKMATEALHNHQSRVAELWAGDTLDYAKDYPRVAAAWLRSEVESKLMATEIKSMEVNEIKPLVKIVAPPPSMDRGKYDGRLRLMVMKLIALGNVHTHRIPIVYKIVSNYHGIQLPPRERSVVVARKNMKTPEYKKRTITWFPSLGTCDNIRTEMGCFSQLQVGEAI